MLPTEDAAWVAGELADRFGLPTLEFALSATDANRWALRLARLVTRRPRSSCSTACYHGTVDETFAVAAATAASCPERQRRRARRPRDDHPRVRVQRPRRVERELAHGDVACVLPSRR